MLRWNTTIDFFYILVFVKFALSKKQCAEFNFVLTKEILGMINVLFCHVK